MKDRFAFELPSFPKTQPEVGSKIEANRGLKMDFTRPDVRGR